jgi:hypothetical protein
MTSVVERAFVGPPRRADVENLWTGGENPVDGPTAADIF